MPSRLHIQDVNHFGLIYQKLPLHARNSFIVAARKAVEDSANVTH
jgi:hypothetical protein